MRPRDPVLNVGLNNKININIPVGTDQLKVAINRVSCAAQCAEPLLEWIETVNLKTVEAWNIVKLAAAASWWPVELEMNFHEVLHTGQLIHSA